MLKVIEGGRDEIEKALILELFAPRPCNQSLLNELSEKLEPRKVELTLLTFSNQDEQ